MSWYRDSLEKNKNEILKSAVFSMLPTLIFSIWYFLGKKSFEWQSISPISQPSLLAREFYSALVFVTIGAFLYYVVKLWRILYFIIVEVIGSRELYRLVKSIIWVSLILAMYFYIVPKIVDFLNGTISVVYNISILLLYLFPPIGLFVIIFFIGYLAFKKTY